MSTIMRTTNTRPGTWRKPKSSGRDEVNPTLAFWAALRQSLPDRSVADISPGYWLG